MVVTWVLPSRRWHGLRGWWSHSLEGTWVPELLSEQNCFLSWIVTGEKNTVVPSLRQQSSLTLHTILAFLFLRPIMREMHVSLLLPTWSYFPCMAVLSPGECGCWVICYTDIHDSCICIWMAPWNITWLLMLFRLNCTLIIKSWLLLIIISFLCCLFFNLLGRPLLVIYYSFNLLSLY